MNVRRTLAVLAGARPDLAEQAGDLTKQAAMGGVLLSTALVAGVSAFFALDSTLHLAWPAAAAAGVVWALVILNLDRMLIVSMNGLRGTRLKLWAAVPRLLLAIVIGAVISTPLTLRIFAQEINAQLQIMHAQQIADAKTTLVKTYADIPDLQNQVATLQGRISGQLRPAISDDPDVKTAQAAYDTAAKIYEDAQANAQCELNGTCGSHHVGIGPAYLQAQATADAARQKAAAARAVLDNAEKTASSRQASTAAQLAANARKQLPDVQARLDGELAAKQAANKAAITADNANTGMLSQLEALDEITSGHPTAIMAHLMLFLLFLLIELLPVLAKLLSTIGEPSAYDNLLAQADEHVKELKRLALESERQRVAAETQAELDVNNHYLAEKTERAKQAATMVVERQATIAVKAVEIWADLASRSADAELNRWIHAHQPQPKDNGTWPHHGFPAGNGHARPGTSGPTTPPPPSADEQTIRLPKINYRRSRPGDTTQPLRPNN
jgi:hypothetical protein